MENTLRFGILSTASINSYGFLPHARRAEGVELVSIASRDAARARSYAEKHGIPHWHGSYEELLESKDVNSVYIPLPASMHAEWSIRAMEAGKHVLCEKPATVSAAEMERVAEAAERTGMAWAEAFHNRHHPVVEKALEMARDGEIGEIIKTRAVFCIPLLDFSKVQYKPELGGGALLDVGCYAASFARWAAGCDSFDSVKAKATNSPTNGVNLSCAATIQFSNGVAGEIYCSFLHYLPEFASIAGSRGRIALMQYIHPVLEIGGKNIPVYALALITKKGIKNIRIESETSYYHQLEAFSRDVRSGGGSRATGPREALANMRLLDAIAESAGIR